jgi:N6-adenosine-specific RNA methylase IME4
MELVRYEAARHALAEATRVDEAKEIQDKAAALAAYGRQAKDTEMETWAAEIRLRAQKRIGELSLALEKSPGGRPPETRPTAGKSFPSPPPPPKREVLRAAGISTSQAHRAEKLAKVPEEVLEAKIAEAKAKRKPISSEAVVREVVRKARREERIADIQEEAETPLEAVGTFPVLLADPPWRYDYSVADSRKIENQYPTMTLEAICALRVPATDDAALFLWATSPKLTEALAVVSAWGFTYRTCAVWDKQKIGMGYYFRQQHELLLVAIKGKMVTPAPEARVSSVIQAPRGQHSAKPDAVYAIIEAMYPDFPKIELFARRAREGWSAWGNQAP